MFVVDVGASGGIDGCWFEFGDQLKAIGFDPLTTEIERLSANAPREVAYVAAWVTSRSPHVASDGPDTHFFSRTSAVRAAEIGALDYAREYFNAGAEMALASERIVLDGYFDADDSQQIDFVKIDTDGHDFEVLRGCDRILHGRSRPTREPRIRQPDGLDRTPILARSRSRASPTCGRERSSRGSRAGRRRHRRTHQQRPQQRSSRERSGRDRLQLCPRCNSGPPSTRRYPLVAIQHEWLSGLITRRARTSSRATGVRLRATGR